MFLDNIITMNLPQLPQKKFVFHFIPIQNSMDTFI